ncbi:MAG: DUF362 domain-containing protein [Prolixibacteraceae bacterium]|nr:DUF362 domain-containing protein [Prolixibacteraceae bacterium]
MKRRLTLKIALLRKKLKLSKFTSKLIFLFIGISSTLWFLIRVIPKPQRAGYPCMRAAAPFMSAFIVYLISLGGSVLLFKKAMHKFRQGSYILASIVLVISFVLVGIFTFNDAEEVLASVKDTSWERGVLPEGPNAPIGEGWGVFPGRVAWVWDTEATNEYCTNTVVTKGGGGFWGGGTPTTMDEENSDAYFQQKNNNQEVINTMADKSIIAIGGGLNVADSWDAIFKSFNNKRKGIDAGYTDGETIFIKINNGQAGWLINDSDLSEKGNRSATGIDNGAVAGTTPATVLAFIRQLVDEVGVPQNKIYVAEPMTHVYKSMYDVINSEYPDVIILDKQDKTSLGRTTTTGWVSNSIIYSDKGTVMPDGIKDVLMKEMYNASYMINISALKAHARNGVSLTAKLHFGSHGDHGGNDWGSFDLHDGLISIYDNDAINRSDARTDYNMYRVLTDLMGHEKLGLNTVLFVVDGLWGGIEATDIPVWWWTEPFNGDFPNSLFVSQDAVALESVCIDFLRAEADENEDMQDRPFFPAIDDHLHQAASKEEWAAGITYDPEGDGTEMPASIGVHEHWNNPYDKQYTKNIDPLATKGIELYNPDDYTSARKLISTTSNLKVFPNPCTNYAEVNFTLEKESVIELSIVSTGGQTIQSFTPEKHFAGTQSFTLNTSTWAKGNYVVLMKSKSNSGMEEVNSTKLIVSN